MSITNATLALDNTVVAPAIYTSSGSTAITTVYLCNRTSSAVTVNVFAVLSGTFASQTTNMIYSNLVVAGNDTYVMEWERLLFINGDFLAANASVNNSVVATISYTGI